jgi:NDP-sugar pyrophosphorylase family protein/lipopolysaccharide/colanic/teichoic acid biosynthesis glycosyltransferase
MRALVIVDRLGAELAPLTEKLPVACLPIAGKELAVYTIEELIGAGIRDLTLVASAQGEQRSVSTLGDGQRWGARIRHVLSRGEESAASLWSRFERSEGEAIVVLRGDVLRSPAASAFLDEAQSRTGDLICGTFAADPRGGLLLVRPGCPDPNEHLDRLSWSAPSPAAPDKDCIPCAGALNCLQDLPAFHQANRDLIAGRLEGLEVAGRSVALGLTAGRGANVSAKSLKQGMAYVGAHSRVHSEAELLGEVVIGDAVVVDRAATIRDSVILPHTYVGELVEVRNAIVSGNDLMRVDTGARLSISEAFLLGKLGRADARHRQSWLDRLLGLVLLVLSVPLWPLAAAAAALSGKRPVLTRGELVGNRAPLLGTGSGGRYFVARSWNTAIPVLRALPRLLDVVRGDLRLIGVSPLTPEESSNRTEDWQMVRDRAPVGLLGPTQLNLEQDAPLEERLLSDAFYTREQTWVKDLGYLVRGFKALFSPQSWRHRR